jgi:hypothetical protein
MKYNEVNQKILELIDLNEHLADLNYNDPKYDELEEKVYNLQDEINEAYGKHFDTVIQGILDQLKSKDDLLNFTDYVARSYNVSGDKNPDGSLKFDKVPQESTLIIIKPEALNGKRIEAKLYIKPNPLRIGLAIGDHERIVWSSESV